jgi:hypothetical protein
MWGVGVTVGVRHVGMRCWHVPVRGVGVWRVRMRGVGVVVEVAVCRRGRIQMDVGVNDAVVRMPCIAVGIVVGHRGLRGGFGDIDGRHHRHDPARPQQRPPGEVFCLSDVSDFSAFTSGTSSSRESAMLSLSNHSSIAKLPNLHPSPRSARAPPLRSRAASPALVLPSPPGLQARRAA